MPGQPITPTTPTPSKPTMRTVAKSLSYAMVVQTIMVLVAMTGTMIALARFIPLDRKSVV